MGKTLSPEKLETFVPQARRYLVATARDHRLVPYMEMANAHGGRGYFGQVLDELNRREHAKGHPLISAIVVSAQSHEPSEGVLQTGRGAQARIGPLKASDLGDGARPGLGIRMVTMNDRPDGADAAPVPTLRQGLGVSEAVMRRWQRRGFIARAVAQPGILRLSPSSPRNRHRSPLVSFPLLVEEELPTVSTTNVDGS